MSDWVQQKPQSPRVTTVTQTLTLTNESHPSCPHFGWLRLEMGWWRRELCKALETQAVTTFWTQSMWSWWKWSRWGWSRWRAEHPSMCCTLHGSPQSHLQSPGRVCTTCCSRLSCELSQVLLLGHGLVPARWAKPSMDSKHKQQCWAAAEATLQHTQTQPVLESKQFYGHSKT